jgi:rhodanese-related sulfurtransferase
MDPDITTKIENELNAKGIKIISNVDITCISRTEDRLIVESNKGQYSTDIIILSAGVTPNSLLAKQAGLELGKNGGVKVNRYLQSSDENIYAIGDCAETVNIITGSHEYWPLGSISTKMGRIAADNICGNQIEFHGFIGTAMFRFFDINVARTGLTYAEAEENGFDAESVSITGMDKPHYSGNALFVMLKLIADRKSRRVLGAQGYGRGDIISRISTLAGAITARMTLDDIFKLDLGYHPAYNNPIDTIQTACLVLQNKIDGLVRMITLEGFENMRASARLIDVSPLTEHDAGSIPGSINIPLEAIRREEVPFAKNERIVLYSQTSSGAYEAYRYLITRGYADLHVLEGGYIYWER